MAPGASLVAFITSVTRLSRWAEITTTRFGSAVPGSTASTSMISVGLGMRSPETTSVGVSMRRHPPQPAPMASKRAFTQRRAAPMPRVSEVVSERVWRVPKPTRCSIVACSSPGETSAAISRSIG